MEREGKDKVVGEEAVEKKQLMMIGEKLKRGIMVGKRGGTCSTPSPTWRIGFFSGVGHQDDGDDVNHPAEEAVGGGGGCGGFSTVSARKLGANLWEIQPHLPTPLASNMNHGRGEGGGAQLRRRRNRHRPLCFKETGFEPTSSTHLDDNPPQSPTHRVAPFNPVVNPTSSLDSRHRIGESSYSLKTSKELLKVLNRIWRLEEQHASNMSLVKALKNELEHSRKRIKELIEEKQADHCEMDNLVKKLSVDKMTKRIKEQDRIKATVQSVQEELEDEKRLRKRSESLHRKLARELSEVKSSFSSALTELEREQKARVLLEDLCDEFGKGILDYELMVRSLKQKADSDIAAKENPDRMVLHIAEAWLDERMQMKQLSDARTGPAEKSTVVDRLCMELETFLRAKGSADSREKADPSPDELKRSRLWRQSLESFHLNGAGSAPKIADNDEDSSSSDLHNSKLQKDVEVHLDETKTLNAATKGSGSWDDLPRNRSSRVEGEKLHPTKNADEISEVVEQPAKCFQGMKDNTLKAKLLEARLEARRSRSKASQTCI